MSTGMKLEDMNGNEYGSKNGQPEEKYGNVKESYQHMQVHSMRGRRVIRHLGKLSHPECTTKT